MTQTIELPGPAVELVGVGYGRMRNQKWAKNHPGYVNDGKNATYSLVKHPGSFGIERHLNISTADVYRRNKSSCETELALAQRAVKTLKSGLEDATAKDVPQHIEAFERDLNLAKERQEKAQKALADLPPMPEVDHALWVFPPDPNLIEAVIDVPVRIEVEQEVSLPGSESLVTA